MEFTVSPATADRFSDLETLLAPRRPGAGGCWCLTYRLDPKENQALLGPARRERARELCEREIAPGVLAYDGDTVVGWAGVAPRADLATFDRSTKIPRVDDLDVWTVWCFRVRAGHRGRGVARALLAGAVEYARACGAPAVEGYPADPGDARVDTTMAFVGTRALFEHAGFTKAADTLATADGFPRVLMRLPLVGPAPR